jgi:hypothetical protein
MGSKILLGIILGILAGGAAKDVQNIGSTSGRLNAPHVTPSASSWIPISAAISGIIALFFIIFTFIEYPFTYGFMAIGEVFFGAVIAGLMGYPILRIIGYLAAPLGIFFWILL